MQTNLLKSVSPLRKASLSNFVTEGGRQGTPNETPVLKVKVPVTDDAKLLKLDAQGFLETDEEAERRKRGFMDKMGGVWVSFPSCMRSPQRVYESFNPFSIRQ
jgi:hypothetical protein